MFSNPPQTRSTASGFTLIELVVTIAVLAILTALALPSFNDAFERNRIASQANDMIAAMMYARSDAIRRGTTAGVCASSNQTTCSGTWDDGWIVWSDADRDDTIDADEVLRVGAFSGKDTMTATGADSTDLRFDARGLVAQGGGAALSLQPAECDAGKLHRRDLELTALGQVRLETAECD